jgi:hypothetical protein
LELQLLVTRDLLHGRLQRRSGRGRIRGLPKMDADRRPLALDYDAGSAGLGKRRHRIGGAP